MIDMVSADEDELRLLRRQASKRVAQRHAKHKFSKTTAFATLIKQGSPASGALGTSAAVSSERELYGSSASTGFLVVSKDDRFAELYQDGDAVEVTISKTPSIPHMHTNLFREQLSQLFIEYPFSSAAVALSALGTVLLSVITIIAVS